VAHASMINRKAREAVSRNFVERYSAKAARKKLAKFKVEACAAGGNNKKNDNKRISLTRFIEASVEKWRIDRSTSSRNWLLTGTSTRLPRGDPEARRPRPRRSSPAPGSDSPPKKPRLCP
jgi:hypothetical protein